MPAVRDDEALARAWRAGDRDAGSVLAARFVEPIRRYFSTRVRPQEAEDLGQETLARLSVAIASFRFDASVRTYVYRIADRVLCDHLRRRASGRGRRDLATCSLEQLDGPLQLDACNFAHDPELLDVVRALRKLPANDQTLFELRYVEGLSYAELITVLDLSCKPATLRVRVHAIKRELQRLLGERSETLRGPARDWTTGTSGSPGRPLVGQLRARLDRWIRRRRASRSWA